MNSFILISKDNIQQENYIKNFAKEHVISSFDITRISSETSVGIEVVRKLQETILLKPFQGKEKMVVIEHAETLTTEAQNALLKLLEEPPLFVYIFLCSSTKDTFLPTVLSRCKTVTLDQLLPSTPRVEPQMLEQNFEVMCHGSIGEKLALAEKLSQDKENLPAWFEEITKLSRVHMLENDGQQFVPVVHALQEGYKTFTTTNVSPRTLLEHIFLTIEQ